MIGGMVKNHFDMALILEGDESESHKEATRKRGREVYEFTHSDTFRRGVAITTITSIPRWHMARALFSEQKEDGSPSGIGHSIRACFPTPGSCWPGAVILSPTRCVIFPISSGQSSASAFSERYSAQSSIFLTFHRG